MILRKIIGFFITSFLLMLGLAFLQYSTDPAGGFWGWFWFVGIFAAPCVLFYGMLISFVSDIVLNRFQLVPRAIYAFAVHLTFGVLFTFIIYSFYYTSFSQYWSEGGKLIFMCAAAGSVIYWGADEILRRFVNLDKVQSAM
ncbi:hypothetical protein [Jeotgalibacillus sp. R-1-5s-1]|uniref:hypothetical protein n=1 Tax=Jeotgalibacillus sp. R-1-5s-1 TaxID=2555897 RepID=UPI001069332D|nr:hypothetical protein [Jeotgalibacillus sp. R-1-5s-1]TFD93640.1 hypothetical protein E2491_14465 [Jeotgalibacillus sp. R-1-5s-1]